MIPLKPGTLTILNGEVKAGQTSYVLSEIAVKQAIERKRAVLYYTVSHSRRSLREQFRRYYLYSRFGKTKEEATPEEHSVVDHIEQCYWFYVNDSRDDIYEIMDQCAGIIDIVVIDYIQQLPKAWHTNVPSTLVKLRKYVEGKDIAVLALTKGKFATTRHADDFFEIIRGGANEVWLHNLTKGPTGDVMFADFEKGLFNVRGKRIFHD